MNRIERVLIPLAALSVLLPVSFQPSHGGTSAGTWSPVPPPSGRYGHTSIHDPVRDRMIMFGGFDGTRRNEVWSLTLSGPATWSVLATAGGPPSRRYDHAAVYDSVRDRMIVIGGDDGHDVIDVWALSLSGTPTWSQIVPAGPLPPGRHAHSAIYVASSDRVIVFGGKSDSTVLADCWELSLGATPTWTALASFPIAAGRYRHAAIYDAPRQRMIIDAGHDGVTDLSDTWELALVGAGGWTQIVPGDPGPPDRESHSAIYDPVRERMIIFGGESGDPDAWALLLTGTPAWSLGPQAPYARSRHSAIYDPARDRVVMFGGAQASSVVDVLELSAPAWSTLPVASTSQDGRLDPAAVYDPLRDRVVLFGGGEGSHAVNTTRVLSLAGTPQWSVLATAGTLPSPRAHHRAIYDPVGDRMIVIGGYIYSGEFLNDVWALSLSGTPTWTQLLVAGTPPDGRWNHTTVYDPVRRRVIVFGGHVAAPTEYSDETWELSLDPSPQWTLLAAPGTRPSPRFNHSAIYDPLGNRMVVYGGENVDYLEDTYQLSLVGAPVWDSLATFGPGPLGHRGHAAFYDPIRHQMVVSGGVEYSPTGASYSSNVWVLTLAGASSWSRPITSGGPPAGRYQHVAIYDPKRDRAIFSQGFNSNYLGDTWTLSWGDPQTPAVACSADLTWSGGPSVTARYAITNPLGTERVIDWTLSAGRAWPGLPAHGRFTVGAKGETLTIAIAVPDTATNGRIPMTLKLNFAGAAGNEVSCTHDIEIIMTAVLASLVTAQADPGRAQIEWHVATAGLVTVERRQAVSAWRPVGEVEVDGRGHVTFVDDAVEPGERYGYRLAWSDGGSGGRGVVAGETWIDVPRTLELTLRGVRPNPGAHDLAAVFALPRAGAVVIECFDVSGRRAGVRENHQLAAGSHVIPIAALRSPSPGVYLVRMTFEGHSLWTRTVAMQ